MLRFMLPLCMPRYVMYVGHYWHDLSSFFGGMANSGYRILSGPGTLLLYQVGKRLAFLPFALVIENPRTSPPFPYYD